MLIRALEGAIDGMVEAGAAQFADPMAIQALYREMSRLQAVVTAATTAFDASQAWSADGAKNVTAWISTTCHLPKADVRRGVRLGRALKQLPQFEAAWLAGDVNGAHVDAVAAVRRPKTEELLRRDEAMLVDQARSLRFDDFRRVVAYWNQLADPDGTDRSAELQRGRRGVHLVESFDGMWLGQITLDPISGTIVGKELARLERHLFEHDWAVARDRLGRDPTVEDLARTSGQRRADALVEMAARSRSTPDSARRPAPLFTVFVGYETLRGRICELADGQVIAPGELLPWLSQAEFERALFHPDNRVEVSPAFRFFSGGTRRAIEVRDRRCAHPFCDEPAEMCEIDHIIPYAWGGPTTQENGRLYCSFHNRSRNQRPPPAA